MFVVIDVSFAWSIRNILWYLCGISGFLMQKDFVSPNYLKKWSTKGIQVVAWTVNTFDEKSYYESHLASSSVTDSVLEDCTSVLDSPPTPSPRKHVQKLPAGLMQGYQNTPCASPDPGRSGSSHK